MYESDVFERIQISSIDRTFLLICSMSTSKRLHGLDFSIPDFSMNLGFETHWRRDSVYEP